MKRRVRVTQEVDVEIDETKFDETFMREFRESFYRFYDLNDHIEHLAQLMARGVASGFPHEFIEGYGPVEGLGIKLTDIHDSLETEIV